MNKLIIYRDKGLDLTPIQIEINKEKFYIKRGEKKEIELPKGKYKILAKGWFGLSGSKEIEINENNTGSVLLTQTISSEISLIGVSIVLLTLILLYVELIPIILAYSVAFVISISLFLFSTLGRNYYYRFK